MQFSWYSQAHCCLMTLSRLRFRPVSIVALAVRLQSAWLYLPQVQIPRHNLWVQHGNRTLHQMHNADTCLEDICEDLHDFVHKEGHLVGVLQFPVMNIVPPHICRQRLFLEPAQQHAALRSAQLHETCCHAQQCHIAHSPLCSHAGNACFGMASCTGHFATQELY